MAEITKSNLFHIVVDLQELQMIHAALEKLFESDSQWFLEEEVELLMHLIGEDI